MRVLQRLDALGNHIVMLEHLVDGARLLAHELAVDIGDEQFVTELGHGGVPVASGGERDSMVALAFVGAGEPELKRSARLALARIRRALIVSASASRTLAAAS